MKASSICKNPLGARTRNGLIVSGLLAVLLVTFEYPLFWKIGFCLPAAKLAAIFLGASCVPAIDGYRIDTPNLPVHVTLACSAARFFVLLACLSVATVLAGTRKAVPRNVVAVLALAYVSTVAANVTRIVLGWHAENWVRHVLPSGFWSSAHAGVGIFVFLSFLVATYAFINWRIQHGQSERTA